jgi:predicted DNA-binding transcriptional regulator YafY
MNRTDRLYAIVEELRRAGPRGRTAARLAERFEVSARTVKRDLLALQDAGAPIAATAGPGGGYVLDPVATLPPLNLTETQAVAIAIALASMPAGPFARDGQAALDKILDVMGPAGRAKVDELAGRIWVQPGVDRAGGDRAGGVRADGLRRAAVTRAVEEALRNRVVLELDYTDRTGARTSKRPVEPHLIAFTGGHWYLLAWCLTRHAPRWFRWDRITKATVTRTPIPDRDALATFGVPPPDARTVRTR